MRTRARRALPSPVLLFLFSQLLPAPALAADPPTAAPSSPPPGLAPAADSGPAPAKLADHLRRGDRARRAGRWDEAARAYGSAWELVPRADIAGELGLIEESLGQHRDAAEHLQLALEHRAELTPDQIRRFQEARNRAEQHIGVLAISVHPPNAAVFVDGRPLGPPRVTYLVHLEPGPHTIRASLAGHEDAEVRVDVARGSSKPLPLRLQERKPPSPVPASSTSRTAPAATPTAPQQHASDWSTLTYIGIGSAGGLALISAGFLIAGEVVGAQIREASAELGRSGCYGPNATRPACDELRSKNEVRDAGYTVGTIGLSISFGVGVAALTSIWWAPRPEPAPRIRVKPAIGAGRGVLFLDGQW